MIAFFTAYSMSRMSYLPATIEIALANKYRPATIKVINGSIKRVIKGLHGLSGRVVAPPYDKRLLVNYDKVHEFLEGLNKDAVKRTIAHNVLVVLQNEDDVAPDILSKYENLHKHYSGVYKQAYTWQEASPDKFISLENIAGLMDTLGKNAKNYNDILKYVVLSLYVYMPALRGEDYFKLMKRDSRGDGNGDEMPNYIDLDNGIIIFRLYKTSKTHGARQLTMPDELREVVRIWFGVNKTEYFLAKEDGRPLAANEFTMLLNRALGSKISSSDLRKIYIAEILDFLRKYSGLAPPDVSQWRKKLAHAMAHTVEMQEFVYSGYRDVGGLVHSSPEFMRKVFDRLRMTLDQSGISVS